MPIAFTSSSAIGSAQATRLATPGWPLKRVVESSLSADQFTADYADEPPLRVFFGDQSLPLMRKEYANRIAEWEAWDDLSRKAFA